MTAKEQKYFSEFAIGMCTHGQLLLRPADLYSLDKVNETSRSVAENSRLYFICQMPKISIIEDSLKLSEETLEISLEIHSKDTVAIQSFSIPMKGAPEYAHHFKVKAPCYIEAYDNKDVLMLTYPISLFLQCFGYFIEGQSDLEVLYIGQAYGNDGSRNAVDRLLAHTTLQKILAECPHHQEIYLLLFEFANPQFFCSMDGIGNPIITDSQDDAHIDRIVHSTLNEAQLTVIAEAALIRYFQPQYNKIFKDSFPSTNHKVLEDCYEYDFNAIISEVDTSDIGFTTYSSSARANMHHTAKYDLHSPSDRLSFFELSETAKNSIAHRQAIREKID